MAQTLIIAEAGINHGGSIDKAKKLISAAKKAGADIVKFQTYTTEKRVSKGNPAFKVLKQCELSFEQQCSLKKFANNTGIEFLSTAFDEEAAEFLVQDLGLSRIKLASFDVANLKLLGAINKLAKKNKKLNVILSTGMSNMNEIMKALKEMGSVKDLTLLYCKSAYPPKEEELNLNCIQSMCNVFDSRATIGYSNHVKSPLIPALSVLLGAEVIEAHFMTSECDKCVDSPVSLSTKVFGEMVKNVRRFERMLGDGEIKMEECEKANLIFKRTTT